MLGNISNYSLDGGSVPSSKAGINNDGQGAENFARLLAEDAVEAKKPELNAVPTTSEDAQTRMETEKAKPQDDLTTQGSDNRDGLIDNQQGKADVQTEELAMWEAAKQERPKTDFYNSNSSEFLLDQPIPTAARKKLDGRVETSGVMSLLAQANNATAPGAKETALWQISQTPQNDLDKISNGHFPNGAPVIAPLENAVLSELAETARRLQNLEPAAINRHEIPNGQEALDNHKITSKKTGQVHPHTLDLRFQSDSFPSKNRQLNLNIEAKAEASKLVAKAGGNPLASTLPMSVRPTENWALIQPGAISPPVQSLPKGFAINTQLLSRILSPLSMVADTEQGPSTVRNLAEATLKLELQDRPLPNSPGKAQKVISQTTGDDGKHLRSPRSILPAASLTAASGESNQSALELGADMRSKTQEAAFNSINTRAELSPVRAEQTARGFGFDNTTITSDLGPKRLVQSNHELPIQLGSTIRAESDLRQGTVDAPQARPNAAGYALPGSTPQTAMTTSQINKSTPVSKKSQEPNLLHLGPIPELMSNSRSESRTASAPNPVNQHINSVQHRAVSVVRQMMEVVSQSQDGTIELRLNPEELGRVRMHIVPGENSVVMHIMAERPETLDLLKRNIHQLHADLKTMGYTNPQFSFQQRNSGQDNSHSAPDNPTGGAEISVPTTAHPPEIKAPTEGLDIRI